MNKQEADQIQQLIARDKHEVKQLNAWKGKLSRVEADETEHDLDRFKAYKEKTYCEKMIRDELEDPRIRVVLIGPGGEKLVRFANITNNLEHFNGRNGFGAVMGSKKLKAIAVRGTQKVKIYNKEKIKEIAKMFTQQSKTHPLAVSLRENGTMGAIKSINDAGW